MDEKFKEFENWYFNKKIKWEQEGIFVEKAGLGEYGHQYWIKLYSEYGLGNIILFESNGLYWADFEAGNYNFDDTYQRAGIEFDHVNELDVYETEVINYMKRNGAVD